jgi:hypothetical protein
MSHKGQSRSCGDLSIMSASPRLATRLRTFHHVNDGPNGDLSSGLQLIR